MEEPISLVPVRQSDIVIGKPLRIPVYDVQGELLLGSGVIVENQAQADRLVKNGFFEDSTWDNELSRSRPAAPTVLRNPKAAAPGGSRAAAADSAKSAANKEVVLDMDDVRWFVGETLYLQSHDNPAIRYVVKLIGFVKKRTIFVTPPMQDGKLEFVREGQTFVVRAFSGKKAYAFSVASVKSIHSPHPYLHLSYPNQVRCTVVRQGVRAEVKIIASLSLGNPARTMAVTLADLSTGGASGVMKEVLGKAGETGQIKFKVRAADQDEYLNLNTVLRSVAPTENGDSFKYGFEFVDVSPHEKVVLSAFVHQTLVEMN